MPMALLAGGQQRGKHMGKHDLEAPRFEHARRDGGHRGAIDSQDRAQWAASPEMEFRGFQVAVVAQMRRQPPASAAIMAHTAIYTAVGAIEPRILRACAHTCAKWVGVQLTD